MGLILLLLLSLATTGNAQDLNVYHPLAQKLVSWFRVRPELSAGPVWYSTIGNYHGTLTNMASGSGWQASSYPRSTYELKFDGTDDYIAIGTGPIYNFDTSQSMTWAFWIKPGAMTQWQALWAQVDTAGGSNYFIIYVNTNGGSNWGPVTNGVSVGFSSSAAFEILHSTDNCLSIGTWAHLVVTYNALGSVGSRFKIYVNGADVTSSVAVNGTTTSWSSTVVRLGNDSFAEPNFTGSIHEVQIWNRTLSISEVATNYRQSSPTYGDLLIFPEVIYGQTIVKTLRKLFIQ